MLLYPGGGLKKNKGLIFARAGDTLFDLETNITADSVISSAVVTTSGEGRYFAGSGVGDKYTAAKMAAAKSIVALYDNKDWVSSHNIVTYGQTTTTSRGFEFRIGNTLLRLHRATASAYSQYQATIPNLSAGEKNIFFGVTFGSSISDAPFFYAKGKKYTGVYSTGTGSGVTAFDSANALYVGGRFDGNQPAKGAIKLLLAFDRVLTDSEMLSLYKNPWQVFETQNFIQDLIAVVGTSTPSGSLSATEISEDIFSATGSVIISGTLSATETGNDTFSASGLQVSTGTLAVTETGTDIFTAIGGIVVSGALSATETGSDTFSASGTQVSTGALSTTEQNDTFQGSGASIATGTLSVTEAGSDTFSASGTQVSTGSLSATEQNDTFSATGNVSVSGTLTVTETGTDTFFSAGGSVVAGALSATEAGSDTFSASGTQVATGQLIATEQADTFSASGNVIIDGVLAVSEDQDTFFASGALVVNGSLSASEVGLDIFSAYDPGSSPVANEADLQWSIIVKSFRHQSLVKHSKIDILIK